MYREILIFIHGWPTEHTSADCLASLFDRVKL